jgi:hypothetical protein
MTSRQESIATRETVYAAIEPSKKTGVLGIVVPDRDRPGIHRITGGNLGRNGGQAARCRSRRAPGPGLL